MEGREKAQGRSNTRCRGRLRHHRPGKKPAGACTPPAEVCKIRASSVSHLNQGKNLNLCDRSIRFFSVLLFQATGPQPRPSGALLKGRLLRPTARALLWRSKPQPRRHLPGQSRGARVPLQLLIRSLLTRCPQYSDHSTALLPLSTLTTCEPAGDQATALIAELQRERSEHG